ncbi:aspartyl aminopeptidase [Natronocella acetinitrilica]|uniref:M18 family aminopeptidase n=1 Tax=Natronocella acetinitrilica TaxID=414046 RepID=A0AAE3G7G8_9GAMM|nr:M18 family aminopeptidase [Natronocella acetinitrilica]MCP1677191.1 aspartyl aminopeptidase [Natronocella acetinitrilica]
MSLTNDERVAAQALLDFIDVSPSPWHAVANMVQRLEGAGFTALDERAPWTLEPNRGYYVVRDGSSLIAFHTGDGAVADHGFRGIGAHTDSPGFRIKPAPVKRQAGLDTLGVEVYGGPILATFADRDLTLAGRVLVRDDASGDITPHLFHGQQPMLRLPNLAIHLNRTVNTEGLKYDLQDELPLILGTLQSELPGQDAFREILAKQVGASTASVRAWELAVADTQPGAFFGLGEAFIANSQLDNLASCHAGLEALLTAKDKGSGVRFIAYFDHEEIGSRSFKGAESPFLPDTLERIAESFNVTGADYRRALNQSLILSADMAHAHHPNYARYYDLEHAPRLNEGPVIKINVNQRYATDGVAEAIFEGLCQEADVPVQKYVHRNTLPCGSTIGPITAGRIGVRCVDVGNAMWSMHSLRESAGAADHDKMIRVMTHFFQRDRLPQLASA